MESIYCINSRENEHKFTNKQKFQMKQLKLKDENHPTFISQ